MDPKQELLARWQAWQHSIEQRNVAAVSEFLADDFALELVWPNRAIFAREQWLEMLPGYVIAANAVEEQIVTLAGNLAVILHRTQMQATVFGADRSGTFVLSDVWRRYDGVWKVWRRHSTPLTATAMPTPRRG